MFEDDEDDNVEYYMTDESHGNWRNYGMLARVM